MGGVSAPCHALRPAMQPKPPKATVVGPCINTRPQVLSAFACFSERRYARLEVVVSVWRGAVALTVSADHQSASAEGWQRDNHEATCPASVNASQSSATRCHCRRGSGTTGQPERVEPAPLAVSLSRVLRVSDKEFEKLLSRVRLYAAVEAF
jgi:hypothetical protein